DRRRARLAWLQHAHSWRVKFEYGERHADGTLIGQSLRSTVKTPVRERELPTVPRVDSSYESILEYFRAQLPVGREFDGLQWCGEGNEPSVGTTAERTIWIWGDYRDLLQVAVGRD